MKPTIRLSTALSTVVGIPIGITIFPAAAIPVAIITVITVAIVTWHLHHGGRALLRRSPKGTLTFVLDSARKPKTRRRR